MCCSSCLNLHWHHFLSPLFSSDVCLLLTRHLQEVDGSVSTGGSSSRAVRLLLHRRVRRQSQLQTQAAVGAWGRGRRTRQGGLPGTSAAQIPLQLLYSSSWSQDLPRKSNPFLNKKPFHILLLSFDNEKENCPVFQSIKNHITPFSFFDSSLNPPAVSLWRRVAFVQLVLKWQTSR